MIDVTIARFRGVHSPPLGPSPSQPSAHGPVVFTNATILAWVILTLNYHSLLEDLYKISKAAGRLHLVKEDLETQGHLDLEHYRER